MRSKFVSSYIDTNVFGRMFSGGRVAGLRVSGFPGFRVPMNSADYFWRKQNCACEENLQPCRYAEELGGLVSCKVFL